MSDLRLRARSATELVDAAFTLYRRDPLPYIMLTACAYAPWLVLRLILLGLGGESAASNGNLAAAAVVGLGGAIVYLISYSIMSAALVRLASQAYLGEPVDVGAAVRDAVPRIGAIIGAGILKAILMGIGAMFFFVGMIYVATRFFALNEAIILEHRGVGAAFTRSSELSRGRKWHVLKTLALVFLVYFLVFVAVAWVGAISGSRVVTEVLTTAFVVVGYPLIGIAETLLYYDARIRAEGYDIEVMAGSLGMPGTAAEAATR